jgi:hypothetical protein
MKTFKRLLKHLSQSPACSLLYKTSHDPEKQLQMIDDARLGRSSVAALPTKRADDEFSSDNEGVGVFDEASGNNLEFVADEDVSSNDKEVHVDEVVSSDDEVDDNEDVSNNDE